VAHIVIYATTEMCIFVVHISICATESLNYVEHIFYAPHNSNNFVENIFYAHINIFVDHVFLNASHNLFISISIFLVVGHTCTSPSDATDSHVPTLPRLKSEFVNMTNVGDQ
jgi:hypothetical protein